MQGRLAFFGAGVLAGVGAGTGYWRNYQQLKLDEIVDSQLEEAETPLEQRLFKYGRPQSPFSSRTYTSHSVLYDHTHKVPLWSAEIIASQNITGPANRRHSKFQSDPTVPARFSSSNADYSKSGWSRGHMTPAADCKHCQTAMDDSHYLTNIVPQDSDNNSGYWCRLEMFCRDLAKKYSTVHVISGPLYLPSPSSQDGGKKFVKYQVIGAGNVAVPTHLYKVILAETDYSDSDHTSRTPPPPPRLPPPPPPRPPPPPPPRPSPPLTLGVFVVPNRPLGDEELTSFQTTLTDLETMSGISFHSKLDRSQVGDLCKTDQCKLMTALEHKQFVFCLRLGRAKDEQQIKNILAKAKAEGLEKDTVILQKAAQKRTELNTSSS